MKDRVQAEVKWREEEHKNKTQAEGERQKEKINKESAGGKPRAANKVQAEKRRRRR